MSARALTVWPVPDVPLVEAGDDLAAILAERLSRASYAPAPHDVLVLAQKIVSKAEGRLVPLADVQPSARAIEVAADVGKDPRLVELILSEAVRIVRRRPGVLIVEHRLGFVMANAGIDQSNVGGAVPAALLLPRDPDGSAAALRAGLRTRLAADMAVVINDSFGRAWRRGTTGVALGAAGVPSVLDLRGRPDLFGRRLESSVLGFADEIAAAASLVMGQADEGCPAVLVRGLTWTGEAQDARALLRTSEEDLFR